MMLRVYDSDYLDLDETPTIERRAKLFEDVTTINGDFSYSFSIPKTSKNISLLRIFFESTKERNWSKKIPASIEDDAGITIYNGSLKVEENDDHTYSGSFFSGNTNWIDVLNVPLRSLDWSKYKSGTFDGDLFKFYRDYGMVFPVIDNGLLSDRKPPSFDRYELMPFIYVKNIISDALTSKGIKLTGDIVHDGDYNKLVVSSGNVETPQKEIDNRVVFLGKTTQQLAPTDPNFSNIIFDNASGKYYNSVNSNWNFSNNRYTSDVGARTIRFVMTIFVSPAAPPFTVRILKNGTKVWEDRFFVNSFRRYNISNENFDTAFKSKPIFAGDYFDVQIQVDSGTWYVLPNTEIKIELDRFIDIYPETVVPDLTISEFISGIFRLFNKIVVFNSLNNEMIVSSFDEALRSDPIDISKYVRIIRDNYTEFTDDYYRNNLMSWQDQSIEEVERYNSSNDYPYGADNIKIDNDFLDENGDLVSMDYVAPWHRVYQCINTSLPYTGQVNSRVVDTRDITSISQDIGGNVVFNFNGGSINWSGLFRVKNSPLEYYNGTYFGITNTSAISSYYPFRDNSTGQIEFIEVNYQSSDPILLLNNPSLNIQDVCGIPFFTAGNLANRTEIAIGNFISTEQFIGSLSFSDLKYKRFLVTQNVLNSGIKSYAIGNIPSSVYRKIDFLKRVRVNSSVYYVNSITDYNSSKYECELELIKTN